MTHLAYLVSSVAWSAIGFALGWYLASLRNEVHQIKEAVVPSSTFMSFRGHRMTVQQATRWLGVAVVILAIFTALSTYLANDRLAQVSSCQSNWNQAFADVSLKRGKLADDDRKAINDLLLTVYREQGHQKVVKKAFADWVRRTTHNQETRAAHPLPPYPKGDCR